MISERFGAGLVLAVLALAIYLPFKYGTGAPSYPGKVTIRFLTYETGHAQQVLVREIIRRFEEKYPHIHVEPEFNARGRDKIYVEMASGTAPDVIYAVTDDVPKMALRGGIVDIAPYIKRDKVDLSGYFPQVINAMHFNGGMYGFPFHFSTDVLFYNKTLFDQAGVPYPDETWDYKKWVWAAKKLTKRAPDGTITVFGTTPPDTVPWMLSYGAQQFNADYTRCLLNSPEAREALKDRMDLVYKYHVSPTANEMSGVGPIMMFTTGRVAMMPGRTYMVIDFNKQIKDFKYDVAPIPKGKLRRTVRLAVGGICITSQSKHKEEAWQFAKFYASADGGQDILGHEKNCVTAVKELAYSPKYFMKPPPDNTRIFVDSIYDAKITMPPILQCTEYATRIVLPTIGDIWIMRYYPLPSNAKPADIDRIERMNIEKGMKLIEEQTNVLLKEH